MSQMLLQVGIQSHPGLRGLRATRWPTLRSRQQLESKANTRRAGSSWAEGKQTHYFLLPHAAVANLSQGRSLGDLLRSPACVWTACRRVWVEKGERQIQVQACSDPILCPSLPADSQGTAWNHSPTPIHSQCPALGQRPCLSRKSHGNKK